MTFDRYCRVRLRDGHTAYAAVDGDELTLLDGAPWARGVARHRMVASIDAELLVPTVPTKILCVGRNYRAHAKELGNDVPAEPMLFYKPPSSLLEPGGTIELPPAEISSRVEHEAELGVVIGARLHRPSREEAAAGIFGYTIVCDVTARDLQKKDGQWWRAKGMDTFCPVGPNIVRHLDWRSLEITCRVNGAVKQHGKTADMIFGIEDVVHFVAQVVTLEPGDLIATGTPEGVGPLVAGDVLEVEIPPIGTLRAHVAARG